MSVIRPTESVLVSVKPAMKIFPEVVLPMCTNCFKDPHKKPVLAKRSDKMTEELGRKELKKEQKEAAAKSKHKKASSSKSSRKRPRSGSRSSSSSSGSA